MKFQFLILGVTLLSVLTVPGQSRPILIKTATIIDGSERTAFNGDHRIVSGMIVKIGTIKPSSDDEVVDASGLILAPGFIDIHNHSESGLLRELNKTLPKKLILMSQWVDATKAGKACLPSPGSIAASPLCVVGK